MSKNPKVTNINSTDQVIREAIAQSRGEFFALQTIDNSPILEQSIFREVMEEVSALNVGNLSHEMTALVNEYPLLNEACYARPAEITRDGYLMAVAFEAGRRYSILQLMQMLAEECDSIKPNRIETTEAPLLDA